MQIRLLTMVLILVGAINPFVCEQPIDPRSRITGDPLADTLEVCLHELKNAWESGDMAAFAAALDPQQSQRLTRLAHQEQYRSLGKLLQVRLRAWPDPDTLLLIDIRRHDQLARLTYAGPGRNRRNEPDRTQYTFFLFRKRKGNWKLLAATSLETENEDRYGNQITFHETDLPSILRFPRRL